MKKGFSFIEVIVIIFVIMVLSPAIFHFFDLGIKGYKKSRDEILAYYLCQEGISWAKNFDYSSLKDGEYSDKMLYEKNMEIGDNYRSYPEKFGRFKRVLKVKSIDKTYKEILVNVTYRSFKKINKRASLGYIMYDEK